MIEEREGYMGRIGLGEVLIVALVIVVLFGAKNLPKIFKACGEGLKEFKRAVKDTDDKDDVGGGSSSAV